jgi:hypothetical protein
LKQTDSFSTDKRRAVKGFKNAGHRDVFVHGFYTRKAWSIKLETYKEQPIPKN